MSPEAEIAKLERDADDLRGRRERGEGDGGALSDLIDMILERIDSLRDTIRAREEAA